LPILTVAVNRQAVARHGVSADDVLAAVETLGGKPVGVVLEGEKRFTLQVRFPARVRNDETAIGHPAGVTAPDHC
jgi:cobalt-zinc-cadmium resistance protein CzcA